jgi:hypothetical protein
MRIRTLASTASIICAVISLGISPSRASGLLWQVENPFRFFKDHKPFALHEAAFASLRNNASPIALPDWVRRTERALNDPDCRDASTPDRCAATVTISKAGWAGQRKRSAIPVMTETDAQPVILRSASAVIRGAV